MNQDLRKAEVNHTPAGAGLSVTGLISGLLLLLLLVVSGGRQVFAEPETQHAGDAVMKAILASGLGATLFYEEGYQGVIQFAESYTAASLTTTLLKAATDRQRPDGSCCTSFPSGHATKAFMGAGFIRRRYGWRYAVPAYVAATYVGYSRVYSRRHYTRDVVAGAIIGELGATVFTTAYPSLQVSPELSAEHIGVRFAYSF